MSELVRDDACGEAESVTDQMQVIAELHEQSYCGSWTGQQPTVGRQRIEETEESKPLDEDRRRSIDGDHSFGFEFAERYMDGPLIWTDGAKTIEGQVRTLSDAHAGVAEQQIDISAQIVAAEELLLQELVLLCSERTWQTLRCARNILVADQTSEFRMLACPGQFAEDGAQSDESSDAGHGRQVWRLRTHAGHPSEDVRIAAKLLQTGDLGVVGG